MHILNTSRSLISLFLLLILSGIIACSQEVESRKDVHTDLKKIMEKRKLAIESKDMEAYKKLFFLEYLDGGVNYETIIQDMQNQFSDHDKIAFTYEKSPMNYKMNTARMVSTVSYQTEKMEKPVYHQEKTMFRRVGGQWYISGGVAVGLF